MGISSSALASLVIAGTAIGGSTIAVMANTAPADVNSSRISQLSTEADPSALLPGETTAPVDPNAITTPTLPSSSPLPTATPLVPLLPPIIFGGDDEDEDEDDYGQDGYNGDDEDEDEDREDDEEEDD